MNYRYYNPETDRTAVQRIWREVGWYSEGSDAAFDCMLQCCTSYVALIDNEPEVFVTMAPGTMRYLNEELPFAAVSGVTVSHIARKQGYAKRLLAHALVESACDGALVAGLGMFDQGFYDLIGFGTGSYEHEITLDPARIRVSVQPRTPRRISVDYWEMIHAARIARRPVHGLCNFPVEFTRGELMWTKNAFGLGYFDGPNGALSHFIWGSGTDKENGPYSIRWLIFQTNGQFLELMALLKSLGDQVCMMTLREPAGIQIQSLLETPFRTRRVTKKSEYEVHNDALAYWQMRILDLPKCLDRTHLRCDNLRFNLQLSDPIERYLNNESSWCGTAGEYVVTLGTHSAAEKGTDPALPTLTASVNAFTRLWLGVCPATGLAVTDDFAGPPELLETLDWALRLPEPHTDWDF